MDEIIDDAKINSVLESTKEAAKDITRVRAILQAAKERSFLTDREPGAQLGLAAGRSLWPRGAAGRGEWRGGGLGGGMRKWGGARIASTVSRSRRRGQGCLLPYICPLFCAPLCWA